MRQDELGYYYFVDRIGDTFRWKGENVATSEVSRRSPSSPGSRRRTSMACECRARRAALAWRRWCEDELDLDGLSRHVAQPASRLCAAGLPAHPAPDRRELHVQGAQARPGERGLDLAGSGDRSTFCIPNCRPTSASIPRFTARFRKAG